jgi:cell division protein FtsL
MKKGIILLFTLLVPCFLLLEIWGVFRYDKLNDEVTKLEMEQADWLDQNKKVILGIAFYSSPERIDKIAKNDSKLGKTSEEGIIRIEFTEKNEGF